MLFTLTTYDNQARFKQFINSAYEKYKQSGNPFYVDIKEGSQIRSIEQNNYYWSVVVPISKEIIKSTEGIEVSDALTHENLKFNFGTKVFSEDEYFLCIFKEKVISWEQFETLSKADKFHCSRVFNMPSTAKMTTKQFNQYLDLIIQWAADLSFEIPLPTKNQQ